MLWCCDGYQGMHRQERVLPNGRFQLILDLAAGREASIIVGMRRSYSILDTASVRSVIGWYSGRLVRGLSWIRPPMNSLIVRPR